MTTYIGEWVTNGGMTVLFSPEQLLKSFGALAVRITTTGDVELLIMTEDGLAWQDITETVAPFVEEPKVQH